MCQGVLQDFADQAGSKALRTAEAGEPLYDE